MSLYKTCYKIMNPTMDKGMTRLHRSRTHNTAVGLLVASWPLTGQHGLGVTVILLPVGLACPWQRFSCVFAFSCGQQFFKTMLEWTGLFILRTKEEKTLPPINRQVQNISLLINELRLQSSTCFLSVRLSPSVTPALLSDDSDSSSLLCR